MLKEQYYNIHASFLVPVYNLSKEINTIYIATQKGQHPRGSIAIDVWLVNAQQDNTLQSMIQSLKNEEEKYSKNLEIALEEEKPANELLKSPKVRGLEHGKKLFGELVKEASCVVYHKKPDDEFLKIARSNFAQPAFREYKLGLDKHLYLAGLSSYEER